ncbi:hypothetical protein PHO31112_05417 [Pandoraea horticolens]|uniref:Uncharacterized protein n=1 Tax=Pandoraea horticolens TaxID=2508298 RepID=A0A5E4ZDW9_9BURK|nr:hypothetical protein [Pandoraea horticolens]VVE59068.1 hypothetical protein PHO31112_05417 [Pandoraea horticolens]
MEKESLFRSKPIVPGDIYVFFKTADLPYYPSYIRLDWNTGMWSATFTLPGMILQYQEARATYYKGKLYLFGRAQDNSIQVMTSTDGEYWSDSVTLGTSKTCGAITPCVISDSLCIFYPGVSDGNPICCNQYDENLNQLNWWVSPVAKSVNSVSVGQGVVFFNADGVLYMTGFDVYHGFGVGASRAGTGEESLSFGPSVLAYFNDDMTAFYRGVEGDARLYEDGGGSVIENIDIYTAPSVVFLDGDVENQSIAVFYGENNIKGELRMAFINRIKANYEHTYNTFAIQNFGIPLSLENSSPFALSIPQA